MNGMNKLCRLLRVTKLVLVLSLLFFEFRHDQTQPTNITPMSMLTFKMAADLEPHNFK